jgi:16S rRNA (uracil1498-N3)-methyltransferase
MRRRFFVEQFEGDRAVMEGEAAHHLGRVLRAQPGQVYELSDGARVRLACIENVSRDQVEFALLDELPAYQPSLHIALLLSVVKFDAFEWALEKATELGVGRIVPLAAGRSEKALLAATAKRAERWKKILLEASQQSRRVRLPALAHLAKPEAAFLSRAEGLRILLSERPGAPPLRSILEEDSPIGSSTDATAEEANQAIGDPAEEANRAIGDPEGRRAAGGTTAVTLAIGPEGGWTDSEFDAARAAGFQEASLGRLILRTETAVIAALAALNYALGED